MDMLTFGWMDQIELQECLQYLLFLHLLSFYVKDYQISSILRIDGWTCSLTITLYKADRGCRSLYLKLKGTC